MLYSFNESSIFARGKNNLLFLPFEQALYQHEPAVVAKLLSHQLPQIQRKKKRLVLAIGSPSALFK